MLWDIEEHVIHTLHEPDETLMTLILLPGALERRRPEGGASASAAPQSWEPPEPPDTRGEAARGGPPRLMRVRPGWKTLGALVPAGEAPT